MPSDSVPFNEPTPPARQDAGGSTGAWKKLAQGTILVYIFCIVSYLLVASPNAKTPWTNVARLIILVLWMVDAIILFLNNLHYLKQHRLEICAMFFLLLLPLRRLLGSMTDEIGIIMTAIVLATVCAELRGDLASLLGAQEELPR